MNSLKEQIEASAKELLDKAQDVIRAAQELHQEGRLPTSLLTQAVKMCEDGLPYAAEQVILQNLASQMYEEMFTDLPDPTIPFIY